MLGRIKKKRERRRAFSHPNTALGINVGWLAVRDLGKARAAFEGIGLRSRRRLRIPQLDADAVEIGAGEGAILLLEARRPGGPVDRFLERRGPGWIGLGFAVESLQTARQVIADGTGKRLTLYAGAFGRSILVPPELAYDVWIELHQPSIPVAGSAP